MSFHVNRKLRQIKMVILDVDGVLTDGSVIYDSQGGEIKKFNVLDGTGIKFAQRMGLIMVFLSGRESVVVEKRAQELGVEEVYQKIWEKKKIYIDLLKKYNLKADQVCFIGDDILDLGVMRVCGVAVAVPNAVPEVKAVAHLVTVREGGNGAVREVLDQILQTQGKWADLVSKYEN